ncbi:hypothetical protein [Prescottella agglutinans]|uniref:Uncharacterized protein n=1 Tax=Prescottella agglutinans TaxID=1644129 RepID=A0ABT6M8P6_9NOCA|nr:hypothetical protein [Prescottella agglutinans]MDH6280681.1 hypothetical protein [Prescottella agglutinans]
MKTLTAASALSVLCTVSVWLYVVPQLVSSGEVEPGPLFELMVLLPTPIGLIAALVGAVAGLFVFVRRGVRVDAARLVMALGQIVTVVLAVVIVVWAVEFGSTGWELIVLPASLLLGQIVVAAGLCTSAVVRRRGVRERRLLGG